MTPSHAIGAPPDAHVGFSRLTMHPEPQRPCGDPHLGMGRNCGGYYPARNDAIMELHFGQTLSYGQIARKLGVTRCVVAGVINRYRADGDTSPRKPGVH